MRFLCIFLSSWFGLSDLPAQTRYDLLFKGGHVIDPAGSINQVMDVAISNGRIARVAKEIPVVRCQEDDRGARTLCDSGPDRPARSPLRLHGFAFPGRRQLSTGTTTSVDCGGAGWRNFDEFKAKIIDRATTRVLAFINIVGRGMLGPEVENNVEDMDPAATAAKMRQYPELIVGIKTAHFSRPGWTAVERAVEAGRLSGKPVIIDNNILSWTGRDTRTKVLEKMRPGDIHTHTYNDRHLEIVDRDKRQASALHGRSAPPRRALRSRAWIGKLSLAGGGCGRQAGFPAGYDQHGPARQQHHGPAIRHAQLHLKDDAARHEAGRGDSPLHGSSRRNPAPFPRAGHTRGGADSRRRPIQAGKGSLRIQGCLDDETPGHREVGESVLTVKDGRIVFDLDGISFPEWQNAGEYDRIP